MDIPIKPIELCDLLTFSLWDEWLLLTAGDFQSGKFNTMTVSWGMMGVLWNKSVVQVAVRPSRYTYEFIEKYPDFTLSAFAEDYHKTLSMLGAKSGRDMDKVKESGLTPVPGKQSGAPTFAEAALVIECRKIYFSDMEPAHFMADYIAEQYEQNYHRFYIGEILRVAGTNKYRKM